MDQEIIQKVMLIRLHHRYWLNLIKQGLYFCFFGVKFIPMDMKLLYEFSRCITDCWMRYVLHDKQLYWMQMVAAKVPYFSLICLRWFEFSFACFITTRVMQGHTISFAKNVIPPCITHFMMWKKHSLIGSFLCSLGNLTSLIVPAATLGAVGYGYMWWKVCWSYRYVYCISSIGSVSCIFLWVL